MSTEDALQAELEQEVLVSPPPGSRAACLPTLMDWLGRAQGLMFLCNGGGVLTVWGSAALRLTLCALLKAAQDAPATSFPPELAQWLHDNVIRPSTAEDDLVRMACEVLRLVTTGMKKTE